MKKEVLTDLNGQLIIISAHRYALGRRTYIVGSTIEWLKENWEYVNNNSRFVILRDTARELMYDEAGASCDVAEWLNFLAWGIKGNEDFEKHIKEALSYTGKPWPLDFCLECGRPHHICVCSHDDEDEV